MAKLIGTAGHIDHGKTTLIHALTGIDADRLPEEKARGMTIDIGFAFLDLPGHGRVSVVDVPGHEKFLRNMLVGALGIDVALLCVAADEAVMPQTREHLQILELLPVERMVVALTRSDLADPDTLELCREDVRLLLAESRLADAPVIAVSATQGTGLDELKGALAKALDEADATNVGPWYLPIDRAFSVKGHGCVVTGTLARGSVKLGETALLQPGDIEVRIRAIHSHGDPVEAGERGRRTALNLSGVKLEDVHRGMAIGESGSLFETRLFDARIRWIDRPRHAERVRVSIGSEEAIGKVLLSRDDEDTVAQIRLETPVAVALDQPLIVRRYSPPDLLGGGRIAVPLARPRKRGEKATLVSGESDEEAVLQAVSESLQGTPTEEVCRLMGKSAQALGPVFEKLLQEGKLFGFAGQWFQPQSFEAAKHSLLEALHQAHADKPTSAFVPRDGVLAKAGLKWAGKPLDRIVAHLASEGEIEANGTGIRAASFHVQLSPRQREFLDRAIELLQRESVNTPGVHELAQGLGAPPQAVEEILRVGGQAGEVLAVGPGVYYTPSQLEALKTQLTTIAGGKPFAASVIRDALGTTRKYAIPLLEYFDSIRFTTRVGDVRAINQP